MPSRLAPFGLPDRYRLEHTIAWGGMAVVYAAHDELLDRPVAVKILAEHLNEDTIARRRFQREARAAAAVSDHPGVVTIFDVGEHEGRSFIVMERRTGGTVGEAIERDGPIAPDRALRWLREAAAAIDAGHERGIVHRDIKPGNLLLDDHDHVAVADFGIARLAYEKDTVTSTGQVLGTASYISPEQAMGEPATAASDRYSLAVVAYELLAGRKPFVGDHWAAQARAHIDDPPPRAENLPLGAQKVLERGLAKRADDRWPVASGFVNALAQAIEHPRESPRRLGTILAGLAALLIVAAIAAIALDPAGGDGDDGSAEQARSTPVPTETAKPKSGKKDKAKAAATQEATPEPTQEATPEPTQEATPEPTQAPTRGDASPSALNDEGYALFQQGNYAEAIPLFQRAVEGCGGSTELACAYATFNLGAALNRNGQAGEAIPVLQLRLDRWPTDQRGTVKKELRAACSAAGQSCG